MATIHKTICNYCGVGCGVLVKQDRWGRLSVKGDPDYPVNRGMLCSKGMFLHQVAMDTGDRLLYPELRRTREEARSCVGWDEALNHAAAKFKQVIKEHGPEAVAFYVSGQLMTEEYYVANKLMKGFIGSNNIDTNSRLCMSSAVTGYKLALGDDACPVSYDDIELADCFLIAGANPAWCHPILFRRLEAHKEANPDVKIVVVDPRRTQSCSIADLHVRVQPGTDITFLNAVAKYLIEHDMIDHEFIANHTNGFGDLEQQVRRMTYSEAAAVCRIPVEDIIQAAKLIGFSNKFISMWAMGFNQSVIGTNKNLALLNLSLITGQIGKPGAGPFSLTGQPNAMGGREVGGLSTTLAAHRDLENANHRAEIANFWGVEKISEKPGYTATEIVDAMATGQLKAVWIICTNPAVSMPNVRRLERALGRAEFVVVQDISQKSDTVAFADLVLPAAGWLEKNGTMTNSERRVAYLPKVIPAPGEAKPDAWILSKFAEKMGWGEAFHYGDSGEIYDEYKKMTTGTKIDVSGLSHHRLKTEGSKQWPCPNRGHAGTPRLFENGAFYTKNKRAKIHAVPDENHSEKITNELPFVLTTGRIRDQWHTMTRTGKVSRLKQHIDQPFVEIHPDDAEQLQLKEGETAAISGLRGEVRAKVRITDAIKSGVVFLPMHWGKTLNGDFGRANNVTSPLVDPKSKEPDFKFTPVNVEKVKKEREKIVVIGAGAGARQFVESYRAKNQDDSIHVFGREPYLFYNRILLPEYISGERDWESLLTSDDEMIERLRLNFHRNNEITRIDPAKKRVKDKNGYWHNYDKLILGTGSRPFVPPGVPTGTEGVFTLRSRQDADRIKSVLDEDAHILVMGGGLLGLEIAAALNHQGFTITVIEMAPRLMHRQLDKIASTLLQEELEDQGMRVLCDDMVMKFQSGKKIDGARTRNGERIKCDAIIVAVGIRPNIELAMGARLECGRGVVVNSHMQTSDPNIYAIGEIAEHEKALYGITPAANEQADIVAAHLAGEIWDAYKGTLLFNILKINTLDVCSMGLNEIPDGKLKEYDEIVVLDRKRRYYKKCIVYQNRLVGAILIGDKSEFAEYRDLIERKIELDDIRDQLLRPGSIEKGEEPVGQLVCTCNSVGVGNIENAIANGCDTFDGLCKKTKAGTGCGSCKPEVRAILEKNRKPVAA